MMAALIRYRCWIGWTAVILTLIDIVAQTETGIGRTLHEILSGQPLDSSSTETDRSARSGIIPALWVASLSASLLSSDLLRQ